MIKRSLTALWYICVKLSFVSQIKVFFLLMLYKEYVGYKIVRRDRYNKSQFYSWKCNDRAGVTYRLGYPSHTPYWLSTVQCYLTFYKTYEEALKARGDETGAAILQCIYINKKDKPQFSCDIPALEMGNLDIEDNYSFSLNTLCAETIIPIKVMKHE